MSLIPTIKTQIVDGRLKVHIDLKHLPGQHDQSSHGAGGSSDGDFTRPDPSEDPAPGKDYYYHATQSHLLGKIAEEGLVPRRGAGNDTSVAPHLDSVEFWIDSGAGSQADTGVALMRMRRDSVHQIRDHTGWDDDDEGGWGDEDEGGVMGDYDPNDMTAETGIAGAKPSDLEVYVDGKWVPLAVLFGKS